MIAHTELLRVLSYNRRTGVFHWRKQLSSRGVRGSVAGCIVRAGYRAIVIHGTQYLAHRLAWFYIYGEWPARLDHRDESKLNNRILNLRDVTHGENMQNISKPHRDGTSGFRGVCKCKQTGRWLARIQANGTMHHLGRFLTPEAASTAYVEARQRLPFSKEN